MKTKQLFWGSFPTQWIVMGLSLVMVTLLGFFLFRSQARARFLDDTDHLAVNLHSTTEADYSSSLRPNSIAAVGLEIIADILRDEEPDSADTAPRLTQIANSLLTPVATVTGQVSGGVVAASHTPGPSNTPGPSPTGPTPTPSLSPTITLSPTFGPSPTATNSATPGPSPTATKSPTPGPSPTPTKSSTPGPSPTSTKTATPGPSSTPTRTPTITQTTTIGPSSTPTVTQTQTATASPTPTNTSQPPTATNTIPAPPTATNTTIPSDTPDVCSNISLSNFSIDNKKVSWAINNNSSTDIEIASIFADWPIANEELEKVFLDGNKIWDEADDDAPPTLINSDWKNESRFINAGQSLALIIEFKKDGASSGYTLQITFDNGCQVQQSN